MSEQWLLAGLPVEALGASVATPSPLNGERAGVRGEDSRDLPLQQIDMRPAVATALAPERQFVKSRLKTNPLTLALFPDGGQGRGAQCPC